MLRAPIAGRVGDKTVTVGQFVSAGTRLMSLVPLDKLYVVANFKETQLALMRVGQPATIKVDALDGTELVGRVESLSPGTGAQFSLLPPQNATGNFTKITQRVPVRIALDATPAVRALLVPGLSVTVTVDTIGAKGDLKRIRDHRTSSTSGRTDMATAAPARPARASAAARAPERADASAWLAVAAGTIGALMATLDISHRQLVAADHPGRDRRQRDRGHLDRHRLSGGGDRHHPDVGLADPAARPAHLPARRGRGCSPASRCCAACRRR